MQTLEFEKSVVELEVKIEELRHLSDGEKVNIASEISKLQDKANKQLQSIYSKLTPAQKVMVARHADRPHCLDYINGMIEEFTPLAGDRAFAEDLAIVGGLGRFRGTPCVCLLYTSPSPRD